MSTRQIIAPSAPRNELVAMLDKMKGQIAAALPKHLTVERMVRMAVTLFSKSESLQKCSIQSIIACVVQASELGLELTGPLGHAFMVPYGGIATFQIGYKGFFELAFRSGKLSAWPMRTVYANDRFRVEYGTQQRILHEPANGPRGEPTGYYSVLYLKDGGRDFDYISVDDAIAHRDRYSKSFQSDQKYGKQNSPWTTTFDAMAMKTTVRSLAKRAPLSTELRAAASIDEYAEAGIVPELMDVTPGRAERIGQALNGNGKSLESEAGTAEEAPAPEAERQPEPPKEEFDEAGPIPPPREEPKPAADANKTLKAVPEQLQRLDALIDRAGWEGELFPYLKVRYKVRKAADLTSAQIEELIAHVRALPAVKAPEGGGS